MSLQMKYAYFCSMIRKVLLPIFSLLFCFSLFSCEEEVDSSILDPYIGPISTAYDIELYHSDSAIIRTYLVAKKRLEFENGNEEFPEGIDITFYDRDGNVTTTMRADRGYFDRVDNLYRGEGDVRVVNLEKDQSLASEELFWNPNEKRIFTDKFVTIQERETLFNGTGMEADETFTEYKLFKVTNSRTILPGEDY